MTHAEEKKLIEQNRLKYLKAPRIREVTTFIKELEVTDLQFERFFGIPKNTIAGIREGKRKLPARFWHIVYEKSVPAYSATYTPTITKSISIPRTEEPAIESTNHDPQVPPEQPVNDSRISHLLASITT